MLRNFMTDPSQTIEQVFNCTHQQQMQDLPFINPAVQVAAIDFALYEQDWLGILLTPWMLNIMLLPGPEREWTEFKTSAVGEKINLNFSNGEYTFMLNQHPQLGQFLSCSLLSPVNDIRDQAAGVRLAKDARRLLTAIPSIEPAQPYSSHRAFFTGRSNQARSL